MAFVVTMKVYSLSMTGLSTTLQSSLRAYLCHLIGILLEIERLEVRFYDTSYRVVMRCFHIELNESNCNSFLVTCFEIET